MSKKQIFIYHGNCYDGFTAAWVFNRFRDERLDGTVEYFPATYGQDPPDCTGKEVWLVDFSYPRDVMIEKVIKPSARTIIMDHHKTAEAALDGILGELRKKHNVQRDGDRVVFDMKRSGSGILYDELDLLAGKKAGFHKPRLNGSRELWLVDYIEDRDLWTKKLPDCEEVAAYVAATPYTFRNWDAINALGRMNVVEGGRAIKRYIDLFGEKVREQAVEEMIAGHLVPTINTPYMNCSEHVGGLLTLFPDAPFAVGYFRRKDGRWQFSLRSQGDFDVSAIALQFGGGGHKNAAGFDAATLPWADQPGDAVAADPVLPFIGGNGDPC